MRRLGLVIVAAVLAVVLQQPAPAAGQTAAKAASNKAVDAWDTVKAYTVEKKSDAVTFGKKLVRETDAKIKGLEAKASMASGDTKAQYNREIKDLKVKRSRASKKLDAMGKASGKAWDSAKDGFADAYKDLHESFDKVAAQFK